MKSSSLIFALLGLLVCSPVCSAAQPRNLSITAAEIDAQKIPFPGKPITLSAEVSNTRDFRLPVRLLAVRDGKFYETAVPEGILNIRDKPQYQVEIPAPLAELVYEFVLLLPDGSAVSSRRMVLRRNCIPDVMPALGELPTEVDGSERFNRLLVDSKRLEQEIDNLERAAAQITTLTELVK